MSFRHRTSLAVLGFNANLPILGTLGALRDWRIPCERCLPNPCWVDLEYPETTLEFLGKAFPLERVSIHLTRHVEIEQQRTMKVALPDGIRHRCIRADLKARVVHGT